MDLDSCLNKDSLATSNLDSKGAAEVTVVVCGKCNQSKRPV